LSAVRRSIHLAGVLIWALVAACATADGPAAPRRSSQPAMAPDATQPLGAAAPIVIPAPPPPRCEALIDPDRLRRSAIVRTIDAGLGRWLQATSLDPKLAGGRFQGWIIRSLHPDEICYRAVNLRAGDVVTRVNGRSVERPEEALEVWVGLRTSRELVVDFQRDGVAHRLRFGIVDQ
jgi:hypothetical protein